MKKILSTIYPMPFTPIEDNAMLTRIINIKRLLSIEYNVDLICYSPKRLYKPLNVDNGLKYRYGLIPQYRQLIDILHKDYDIIYANTAWAACNSILGKFFNKPIIVDMHGLPVDEYSISHDNKNLNYYIYLCILFLVETISLKKTSKIICVSKKMVEYLHDVQNVPLEKLCYVTNGVDLDYYKPILHDDIINLKNKLGVHNKFIFGYIGGFQKWQGVSNFLQAAKKVEDEKIQFLIVGGNKQYKEGNILYLPKVPKHEVVNLYSLCDVLVLPRPNHPATIVAAPTKFSEYTSMGKPILTTDVGDAAEMVRRYKCGLVVKENTVNDLLEGIIELASFSEDKIHQMGSNARKLAETEYNWDKIGNNLRNIIKHI